MMEEGARGRCEGRQVQIPEGELFVECWATQPADVGGTGRRMEDGA